MSLDVLFRNLDASDALKERAEKKFGKVAKHLREPVEAHLVLREERFHQVAELTVHAAGEQVFRASETTEDMRTSVDGLMSKLSRAARRQRERLLDRAHAGPGKADAASVQELGTAIDEDGEIDFDDEDFSSFEE